MFRPDPGLRKEIKMDNGYKELFKILTEKDDHADKLEELENESVENGKHNTIKGEKTHSVWEWIKSD
jgi:hypothetical protein